MARKQDIDSILKNWTFEPGEVAARIVRGSDGRDVLQMRIEMGIIQLEVAGRPDGERPGGAETYYDFLVGLAINVGDDFVLSDEQCAEADREFVQFYQRRLCWLALREFGHAVTDADHTLAFMDFSRDHSPNDEWTEAHEQYRPFVLFQRTQAAALQALEEHGPDRAIEEINAGLLKMKDAYTQFDHDEPFEEDELVERLMELRESLRQHFSLEPSLDEQLAAAVASEQYELAARLRDEIAKRKHSKA
ncbi:MAG: UvrB/UvrC motif-containing protein [Planctomycetia bacterium]|nr:UvrB/UvrC motif-containing protein [Planctomycetia bacterium]